MIERTSLEIYPELEQPTTSSSGKAKLSPAQWQVVDGAPGVLTCSMLTNDLA